LVGWGFLCRLTALVGAFGCSPSEAPKPVPTATRTPSAPQIVTTATPTGPSITPNPGAAQSLTDFSDTADWEWNLAEEAEGPEFEVDADATSYYMPVGNMVTFKAKALNGTPPFTCKWNFGDDSPVQESMLLKHRFTEVGQYHVWVTCNDASGAVSQVELGLGVTTREDWATRMGYETPTPAATP
jgi:hypothetical protein